MTQAIVQRFLEEWAPRKEISAKTPSSEGNNTTKKQQPWSSCLLVVSSASGFGKAATLAPEAAKALSEHYRKVVVVPTRHKGHAREIFSGEAGLSRYDVAVVLGGDGAFSEALNGMLSRTDGSRVPLAQCPGGSGNAICGNTLGTWNIEEEDEKPGKGENSKSGSCSGSLRHVCSLIGKRKLSRIDVNEITCSDGRVRYSALVLSGGNNADIVRCSDDYRWTHAWFGPTFRYVVGFFVALYRYGRSDGSRTLRVTLNDEEPVTLPAFGFSLYNCGRTTRDAAFSTTQLDGGALGFVAVHRYLGFLKHLKFMKAVKNAKEGTEIPNLYARHDVTSIRVEPVHHQAAATGGAMRPCYLGFDGETMNGSDGDRLAVPFSARVLPGEIEIVVA